MPKYKVCGLGDAVIDLYSDENIAYPGGNALNFAVFTSRLGASASYWGYLADDVYAEHLRQVMQKENVDISHALHVQGGKTWVCPVRLDDGDRVFGVSNRGESIRTLPVPSISQEEHDFLSTQALIHSSIYSGMHEIYHTLSDSSALRSYDFSSRDSYWDEVDVLAIAQNLDIAEFSLSELDEAERIQWIQEVHGSGCPRILATMGAEGQIYSGPEGLIYGTAENIEAMDTMGAGDAFISAFLLSLLGQGWECDRQLSPMIIRTSLSRAARFSAGVCLQRGSFGHGLDVEA